MAAESVMEANDRNQLKPMIEQTEVNTQEKVKEVAADGGYGSYANYEYLEERGIEGYIPDDHFQQYKSGEYQKSLLIMWKTTPCGRGQSLKALPVKRLIVTI
ncbi:MAG: transposase [Planctomycetes bacterium]|nr:transposase [Planctomycetota bacterium]